MDKQKFIQLIERIAPPELMESWDNTGIQIYAEGDTVERVLVCLDVCDETLAEAIENKCDFIVSHHPLIFTGIKSVDARDNKGRIIAEIIKNGISVYSSHTSFDTVQGGNNDHLASVLGMKDTYAPEEEPIMRIGNAPSDMTMRELCKMVNETIMKGQGLEYSGDLDKKIGRIAVCTGAGADMMETALENSCDVLITGDVKYHDFQRADELGINLIDAGHFETEISFTYNMSDKLKKELGTEVEVIPSVRQKNSLKRYPHMI